MFDQLSENKAPQYQVLNKRGIVATVSTATLDTKLKSTAWINDDKVVRGEVVRDL